LEWQCLAFLQSWLGKEHFTPAFETLTYSAAFSWIFDLRIKSFYETNFNAFFCLNIEPPPKSEVLKSENKCHKND